MPNKNINYLNKSEEENFDYDESQSHYLPYEHHGDYVDEIYFNYDRAIGRTSDYRGDLVNHILNGYADILMPFRNEGDNSCLVGFRIDNCFVVSHFAPSGFRTGNRLMNWALNADIPIFLAVPEFLANQLKKIGFIKWTDIPQFFAGEFVNKEVMFNRSVTFQDRQNLVDKYLKDLDASKVPVEDYSKHYALKVASSLNLCEYVDEEISKFFNQKY